MDIIYHVTEVLLFLFMGGVIIRMITHHQSAQPHMAKALIPVRKRQNQQP